MYYVPSQGPRGCGGRVLAGPVAERAARHRLRQVVQGVPTRAGVASRVQDAGPESRQAARLAVLTD